MLFKGNCTFVFYFLFLQLYSNTTIENNLLLQYIWQMKWLITLDTNKGVILFYRINDIYKYMIYILCSDRLLIWKYKSDTNSD